jgi:hypothetical protein
MALPPGGSTCAEPPPEIMPTSECAPMTAMVRTLAGSRGQSGVLILEQDDAAFFDLGARRSSPMKGSMTMRWRG